MIREQLSYKSILVLNLLFAFLCSCSGYKRDKYVNQIKGNLPIYDSVNASLIAKYATRSIGNSTIIYPSENESSVDYLGIHDSSIYKFCNRNDIGYIQIYSAIRDTTANAINVTYYLHDPNYQYIFESVGVSNKESFENTRVLVVPITKNWTFQYEKPNF